MKMDEGYFPVIKQKDGQMFHFSIENANGKHLGCIQWREPWGCYVFYANEDTAFGPAFLTNLSSQMIRLEAQRRKIENNLR